MPIDVQGPSENEQPHDSLPSSIPMVYGNIMESQMTQTTLDHQELMRDRQVYRQYQAQGVIASPTLYQLSHPDSEEEAQLVLQCLTVKKGYCINVILHW